MCSGVVRGLEPGVAYRVGVSAVTAFGDVARDTVAAEACVPLDLSPLPPGAVNAEEVDVAPSAEGGVRRVQADPSLKAPSFKLSL